VCGTCAFTYLVTVRIPVIARAQLLICTASFDFLCVLLLFHVLEHRVQDKSALFHDKQLQGP